MTLLGLAVLDSGWKVKFRSAPASHSRIRLKEPSCSGAFFSHGRERKLKRATINVQPF